MIEIYDGFGENDLTNSEAEKIFDEEQRVVMASTSDGTTEVVVQSAAAVYKEEHPYS